MFVIVQSQVALLISVEWTASADGISEIVHARLFRFYDATEKACSNVDRVDSQ